MVQKSEKTAVLVLIQGLFDRSRSRTVDTLPGSEERGREERRLSRIRGMERGLANWTNIVR